MLEVGADVRVAVPAVCEALGSERRGALVVEVPEALELVERLPSLGLIEATPFQAGVELGPRAVGCAERAEGDLLRLLLRQPLRAPSRRPPERRSATAWPRRPGRGRSAPGAPRGSAASRRG